MCTIQGDKQELRPDALYAITREAEGGKLLAFYNATRDTQFNLCYTLQDPKVTPLGPTQVADGGKYAISVYPGETKEFLRGTWRGFKRSMSFGAPDKEWQAKQAAKKNDQIDEEIADMRAFVKEHPKGDGKYTAEYMADLCEQHKRKFVDLTFPPTAKSLARDWEGSIGDYAFARPEQWCTEDAPPQLFVGDIEPNDIDQGCLGDCYYLCALACISEFPLLVRDAFSLPQSPELGLYRILVCKNGWWQVVIVDDYLPTKNNKPCFARNREEPNELWVSLLEKAYAKLHGSYSAIRAGDAAFAIADLLGAPYQKLKSMPEWEDKAALWKVLLKADEDDHLMAIGTPGTDFGMGGEKDAMALQYEEVGLATGHAYSMIRVKEPKGNKIAMIRNPWGDEKEWNGAWSDDSPLWTEELQKMVGFYKGDDGTFWMAWDDICKYFDNGSISTVMREYSQLRVTGNFVKGMSDIAIQISVNKPINCYFGFHQRDNRGLPSGDKDAKYVGILLSVIHADDGKKGSVIVSETNKGAFADMRDGYCSCKLEPRATPYLVLLQPFHQDVEKSFTASCYFEDAEALNSIEFVCPTMDKPTRYTPASRCVMSDWTKKAPANYQLRMAKQGSEGMILHALQGEAVDLKVFQRKAAGNPAGQNKAVSGTQTKTIGKPAATAAHADPNAAPAADPSKAPQPADQPPQQPAPAAPAKRVDTSQPKQPQQQPVAAPGQKPQQPVAPKGKNNQAGSIKMQLIVLSGRNLVAKDSNGLSDPYVTVKLKTPSGTKLSKDQRQETRYIKETLNPVWAEVFNFQCSAEDVLCIKCWDKDTFGHDLMGVLNLPVSAVCGRLSAGGPAFIDWFALSPPPDDAKGEIQLAFSWLL